jgi:DNA polymerase III subunit epsilon
VCAIRATVALVSKGRLMPPFAMRLPDKAEQCARQLDASPDHKVLRRLPRVDEIWCRSSPVPNFMGTTRLAVIDTETEGLGPDHKIIELAVVKMAICDLSGDLLDIEPVQSWLENPGRPLSPEIETLTGISDLDLAGRAFDERVIADVFDDVDVIVAANAKFDRGFMTRRFSWLKHPWACTYEIDWSAHGLGAGRSVSSLVTAAGHFFQDAHRAGPDSWAVACLLAMPGYDGRTIAAHLLERARKPTYRLQAVGAPFAVKDALKLAGYRWDASLRASSLDAEPERIANESAWLVQLCPAILPQIERIDWYSRHAT